MIAAAVLGHSRYYQKCRKGFKYRVTLQTFLSLKLSLKFKNRIFKLLLSNILERIFIFFVVSDKKCQGKVSYGAHCTANHNQRK